MPADEAQDKAEPKEKKSKAPAEPKEKKPAEAKAKDKPAEGKEKKDKKAKEAKETTGAEAPAGKPVPEPAKPRPPADPRLKVLKKFHGKFLPKGPLRERHRALMQRWNSGDDHGGVTFEELKSLLDDWRAAREKSRRVKA